MEFANFNPTRCNTLQLPLLMRNIWFIPAVSFCRTQVIRIKSINRHTWCRFVFTCAWWKGWCPSMHHWFNDKLVLSTLAHHEESQPTWCPSSCRGAADLMRIYTSLGNESSMINTMVLTTWRQKKPIQQLSWFWPVIPQKSNLRTRWVKW